MGSHVVELADACHAGQRIQQVPSRECIRVNGTLDSQKDWDVDPAEEELEIQGELEEHQGEQADQARGRI